jgi:phosphatidylglycerol lysyltransferase
VGPDSEQETILRQFMLYCHDNGWGLVIMLPENLTLYPVLGLHLLKVGEEAIVDLRHFTEVTSQEKYFRHIRRRFAELGYTAVRYKPPHPSALIDEVEQISREWLTLPGRREMGFVQGIFERSYVAQTPLYVVRDNLGRAVAFVNEVPSYRPGEVNFDMMRHIPEVPHGTMDFIFQGLMPALLEEGYKTLAMGVAPFAGVGDKPGSSLVARALHQVMNFNWFVHSKGLREFRIKFEPHWEDRFVAYQGGKLALVRIALAIARVVERSASAHPQQHHSQPDFEAQLR